MRIHSLRGAFTIVDVLTNRLMAQDTIVIFLTSHYISFHLLEFRLNKGHGDPFGSMVIGMIGLALPFRASN